jgi:hypothetical protein
MWPLGATGVKSWIQVEQDFVGLMPEAAEYD